MIVFEQTGPCNTQRALQLALEAARQRGIGTLVLPTTQGGVPQLLRGMDTAGLKIVFVTHANGFKAPGQQELPESERAAMQAAGYTVVTATHVLSGAERCFSRQFGGVGPVELVAHTLRMFGQGTKVAVEIAVMALDAGAIAYGQPVVAMGGTGSGVDTALVMRPAHGAALLDTRIDEMLCKPRLD